MTGMKRNVLCLVVVVVAVFDDDDDNDDLRFESHRY